MVLNEFNTFCHSVEVSKRNMFKKPRRCATAKKKAWKTMISGTVSLNSTTDRAANWDLNMFTMINK